MSDFLTELEEDIREERVVHLWHRYGHIVVGVAVAIIIGTTGYTLWGYFKTQRQLAAYTSFSQALVLMQEGKREEALKSFQSLGQKADGYGVLSRLYEAALLPNPEALYADIAKDNKTDPAVENLSKLLKAARAPGQQGAMQALEPLAAPHNAWAPLSLELLAFAALQKGDLAKAADYYTRALKEESLTSSEQARLRMMLAQINPSSSPKASGTK